MSLLLSGPRLSHCDCQALGLAPPGDNLEAALGEPGPWPAAAAAAMISSNSAFVAGDLIFVLLGRAVLATWTIVAFR